MEECRQCLYVNHVTKYTYFCLKCGYYFRSDTNIPNKEDEIKRKIAKELAVKMEKARLKKIRLLVPHRERYSKVDTMWSYGDWTPFNIVDRLTLQRMYQLFLKSEKMNKLTLPSGLSVDFELMEVQETKGGDAGFRSEAFSEFGLKREKALETANENVTSYPI